MPWRGILWPSISPLVKIGRMLSNSLIFLTSMPWITPRLAASLACHPSRSAMSTEFGLADEAVDRGRGVEVLHRDLEAKVLRSLVADRLDHRIGDADVPQFDVLDLLRPDRRKSADSVGADRRARYSRAGLEKRRVLKCLSSSPRAWAKSLSRHHCHHLDIVLSARGLMDQPAHPTGSFVARPC